MDLKTNSTVPQAHVDWLKERISSDGVIIMPDFASKFKYFSKKDAEKAFLALISKSFIANTVQRRLWTKYQTWKRNEGDIFWATQVATISKTRTAGELVAGSVPVAKKLIWNSSVSSDHRSAAPVRIQSSSSSSVEVTSTTLSGSPSHQTEENSFSELAEDHQRQQRPPVETVLEHNKDKSARSSTRDVINLGTRRSQVSRKRDRAALEKDSPLDHPHDGKRAFASSGDGSVANGIQIDYQGAHVQDEASDPAHSDDSLDLEEIDELVAAITSIKHKECNKWVLDDRCVACMVDDYREAAVEALRARELRKSEPADIMILAGTFAPWSPTARMTKVFTKQCLKKLRDSLTKKVDAIDIEDASILRSIRHRTNGDIEEAVEALDDVKDKKLRRLFQQIPNTDSHTQKKQGNKPDRPDFKVMIGEKEVAFGEVTGPVQRNDRRKNGWDLYRLSRFGTAVLNEGAPVVPLVQVIADVGTVYRHFVKARGIMVLAEVGVFSAPTATIHLGALLASLPSLFWFRNCIRWLEDHPNSLKRSWTSADLVQIKKYLN
ncbi:hypothetical protein EDD11_009154 [Mortierella claussenii]|nr:hypothetical protein EDD11_009154 [Mortierella claussenii]